MSGGVTVTGLSETRAAVQALPARVTAALRAVASRTAQRVRSEAHVRLRSQTHGTGATAAALRVVEQAEHRAFIVEVAPVRGRPANLPLWLEEGTIRMAARPFLRPALTAESAQYMRETEAAATAAAHEALD